MFGFVYITTNTLTGERYLGRCAYARRGHAAYLGSGPGLKEAVEQYGRDAFVRQTIFEAGTREELEAAELRLLGEYGAIADATWYNRRLSTHSTKGFSGRKHTEERNEKVRRALSGRSRPEHVVEASRKAMTGRPRSKASREKQAATMRANHPRAVRVKIAEITYPTLTAAMNATGLSFHRVRTISQEQAKNQ